MTSFHSKSKKNSMRETIYTYSCVVHSILEFLLDPISITVLIEKDLFF